MAILQREITADEVGRIGEEIYRRDIRPKVYPQHKGKFCVIDIETGDFEVDEDDLAASKRLRARRPAGEKYGVRIGYTTAYKLGGRMQEDDN